MVDVLGYLVQDQEVAGYHEVRRELRGRLVAVHGVDVPRVIERRTRDQHHDVPHFRREND